MADTQTLYATYQTKMHRIADIKAANAVLQDPEPIGWQRRPGSFSKTEC
jgi:hypothetical protein